jgi:putative flippase GtrA
VECGDKMRLRKYLTLFANRHVGTVFGLMLALWIANTVTGAIGRPLDPIYRLVFYGFEITRPSVNGLAPLLNSSVSFTSALVYWGWLLIYSLILAEVIGNVYRYLHSRKQNGSNTEFV